MLAFDPALSSLVSARLRANPFSFRSAAPVQPSQQTQKGLKWALQNLDQTLGAAQGIPAMPAFGGQTIAPGFDIQNLFTKARAPGSTPAPSGRGTTPVVQAADEEYKALLSQYGGAPGISQLAGMASLPTGFTPTGATKQANLKDYYAAQALQGNANLGTIIKDMGYSGDMAKWAQLHPELAQAQYAKKFGAGSAGKRDIGSFIGDVNRYADQEQASPAGQTSFGNIANPVPPTTALNQGAMVDAKRGDLLPQQLAKTTPDGTMPNFATTANPDSVLTRVDNLLKIWNNSNY